MQLSLDESPPVRYGRWLADIVRGDPGDAATTRRSVASTIGDRAVNSAVLASVAFAFIVVVAGGLGTVAALRPNGRLDAVVSIGALVAVSVPEFVLAGLLVAIVALGFGWLPAVSFVPTGGTPFDRVEILVLPVVTLVIFGGAFGARLVRAAVIDAADQPHVEAARLAGLSPLQVLRRHLLPSAGGPIAQVLAFMVPYLIGGTIVVERVFSYPGIGTLLVEQLGQRDAPVVEAIGLSMAVVVIAAFTLADLVGFLVSPRRRSGGQAAGSVRTRRFSR